MEVMSFRSLACVIFVLLTLAFAAESNISSNRDFGKFSFEWRGLDSRATPSVIVAGAAKAGSTDLWSLLTTVIEDFNWNNAELKKAGDDAIFEKEFNLGFVAGDHIAADKCPSQVMKKLMACPKNMYRNPDWTRNESRCIKWVDDHHDMIPRFSIDANPFLIRETNERLANIIRLNIADKTCEKPMETKPAVIFLLRHPISRTVSYYNYFFTRSDTWPLREVLKTELSILNSNECLKLRNSIINESNIIMKSDNFHDLFVGYSATKIVHDYLILLENFRSEVKVLSQKHPKQNFEDKGLILDSIYYLQLMTFFHYATMNSKDGSFEWPVLVVQCEHMFQIGSEFVTNVLFPFFKGNEIHLKLNADFESKMKSVDTNSRKGQYSNLAKLDDDSYKQLKDFFEPFDKLLYQFLKKMEMNGKVNTSPEISDRSEWWTL